MSQTLTVSLGPSRILALALTVVAAAALACAWVGLPRAAFVPVAAGLILAWAWHLAQALRLGRSAMRSLELSADGSARFQDASEQWHQVEIQPGSYVSPWLVVVITAAGGRRRRALVLLPDSATADELRRLRVWLRWRLAPA